jgi:hypothetical protein
LCGPIAKQTAISWFRYVAETAAEMIIQAAGKPLSLGVSGGWGIGKSSMVKLIAEALKKRGAGKFAKVSTFSMTGPAACRQGQMVRIHLPPSGQSVSLPQPLSSVENPGFPGGLCEADLGTG